MAWTKEQTAAYQKAYRERNKAKRAAYYEQNRERILAQKRANYAAKPEIMRARTNAWTAKNRDKVRANNKRFQSKPGFRERKLDYDRRRNYGIGWDEVLRMIEAQGNACAICREAFDGEPNHRHVDHCHASGLVRGILCHHCNVMLGRARDNETTLENAAAYLRASRQKPVTEK